MLTFKTITCEVYKYHTGAYVETINGMQSIFDCFFDWLLVVGDGEVYEIPVLPENDVRNVISKMYKLPLPGFDLSTLHLLILLLS